MTALRRNILWVLAGATVLYLARRPVAGTAVRAFNVAKGAIVGTWWETANRIENRQYLAALLASEKANGIPRGMLVALAYQESHFRPEIISGKLPSPVGALGIMQIVPKWHPTVNPLDSNAAIAYSGAFLRRLKDKFGTWELALQAYNWGEGNLFKYLSNKGSSLPLETSLYSEQILARVQDAGGTRSA